MRSDARKRETDKNTRKYAIREVGPHGAEVTIMIKTPVWLDGSYLTWMMEKAETEMRRHIAIEHRRERRVYLGTQEGQ